MFSFLFFIIVLGKGKSHNFDTNFANSIIEKIYVGRRVVVWWNAKESYDGTILAISPGEQKPVWKQNWQFMESTPFYMCYHLSFINNLRCTLSTTMVLKCAKILNQFFGSGVKASSLRPLFWLPFNSNLFTYGWYLPFS